MIRTNAAFAAVLLASAAVAHGSTLKVPQQFATLNDAAFVVGAGDEIVISKGTYTGNTFFDGKTDVTVRAKGKVRLIGAPTVSGMIFVNNCTNLTFRGLRLEPIDGTNGFSIIGGGGYVIDRCRVDGGSSGIVADLTTSIVASRCTVNGSALIGISLSGADRVVVTGCRVNQTTSDGIRASSPSTEVTRNRLNQIGDDAIGVAESTGALVADNRIDGAVEVAIAGGSSATVLVVGNRIKNVGLGVETNQSAYLIQDNVMQKVAGPGVKTSTGALSTARNRMKRCETGIELGGGQNDSIHIANAIQKSTANGIRLEAGAEGNLFTRNVVRKSGGFDLFDESGAANSFIGNSFTSIGP